MSENTETEKTEKKAAPAKPSLARAAVDEVVDRVEGLTKDDSATAYTKLIGPSGNKVYVQKRAEVREVHLSGFGKGRVGTVEPPAKNGKVEAHLDVADPDALAHLEAILRELATQPAKAAKEPKPAKEPKVPKEKKAEGESADARIKKIRERAAELGLATDDAATGEALASEAEAAAIAEQTGESVAAEA